MKDHKRGITLMLLASLCVCAGQLCWKLSAHAGALPLLAGFVLYGLGALFMLASYKFGELSTLQPVLSVNYVIALILGRLFFHEVITPFKVAGAALITVGVILIGTNHD
jgi:undecaprenyl phosphate-alpha-L-ara4N flippase subunit ArnE